MSERKKDEGESSSSSNKTDEATNPVAVNSTTEYISRLLMLGAAMILSFISLYAVWKLSGPLTEINRRLAALEGRAGGLLDHIDVVPKARTRLFRLYALFVPLPPLAFVAVYSFYNDSFSFIGRAVVGWAV